MSFVLELIAIIINGVLAGIIVLYVIWDHVKDDLLLRRRVQEFYEDIEKLLLLYSQKQLAKLFKDVYAGKVQYPHLLKELDEYQNKHYYIMNKVKNSFQDNSKYLGLIVTDKDSGKYLNDTHFILCDNGQLRMRLGYLIIEDYTRIKPEELEEVKYYLKSLRNYWKNKHKTFPQKNLQEKLDIIALYEFMRNLNLKFTPDPLNEEELLIKGNLHYFSNDFKKAIDCYEKAIKINRSFLLAWNNEGNTYIGLKQYDRARKCFEECFKIDPNSSLAYNGEAVIYMRQKEFDKALEYLDANIDAGSATKRSWVNKGICHGHKKEYEDSIQSFEKALSYDNNYSDAQYNKACAHSELGEKEKALKSLKKAIDLDYSWKKKADTDPSFETLRKFNEYKELIENI